MRTILYFLLTITVLSIKAYSQEKLVTNYCLESTNCKVNIRDEEKREFSFYNDSVVVTNLAKHLPHKVTFDVYKIEDREGGKKTFLQNTKWYFCKDERDDMYVIIVYFYDKPQKQVQIYTVIDEIHNTYLTYSE